MLDLLRGISIARDTSRSSFVALQAKVPSCMQDCLLHSKFNISWKRPRIRSSLHTVLVKEEEYDMNRTDIFFLHLQQRYHKLCVAEKEVVPTDAEIKSCPFRRTGSTPSFSCRRTVSMRLLKPFAAATAPGKVNMTTFPRPQSGTEDGREAFLAGQCGPKSKSPEIASHTSRASPWCTRPFSRVRDRNRQSFLHRQDHAGGAR